MVYGMEKDNKSALRNGCPRPKEYWALLKRPYGNEYGKDEELKSYSGQKYAYFKCDDKIATIIYLDYHIDGEPKNIIIIDDVGEQCSEVRHIVSMVLQNICSGVSMDALRKTPLCENFPFNVIASSEDDLILYDYQLIREKVETDVLEKIYDL